MTVNTAARPAHHRPAFGPRVLFGRTGDPRWSRPALWGVLVIAFVLYAWALSGHANTYYSAAILSGTQSWKAFFFGALDAGSFITVDKPPMALWVMGLSARIFGFSTWSMLLPQALAGVATVALVHSAVRRSLAGEPYAHAAALTAAVVMTLTPITVAINRDNNPDTVLVLLLTLAGWFCLEALRTGRARTLLLCALFVGLAFNTKMLQAYLVVPAFAPAYLACARPPLLRRLGHLLAAGGVLLVSSAWWMLIVDLWPADSRPYVGGSEDNSVLDLVIGYNGLGRIFGQEGAGGRGGRGFGGEAGIGRLFNDTMAGQISWLLPFCGLALLFAAASFWYARRAGDPAGGAAGGAWVVWGGWLAVHFAVFSLSSGTFHPYYTTAMAPAVAAITAMGGVLMWRAYRGSRGPRAWALPLGVAVTGGWSFAVLRRTPDFVPWLAWVVLGATVLAVLGLVLARVRRELVVKAAVAALVAVVVAGLAGPAAYALTPLRSEINGTNPTAGPSTGGMSGPGGTRSGQLPPGQNRPDGSTGPDGPDGSTGPDVTGGRNGQDGADGEDGGMRQGGQDPGGRAGRMGAPGREVSDETVAYLEANQGRAEWLVAVSSAQQASSIILGTGKPVIAMGGFTGGDPAMTVDRLRELVSSGRLRHVMAGGDRGGRSDTGVTTWVQENCQAVGGQDGLYDCSSG